MAQAQVSNIGKGLQGSCSKDLSKTQKPSTICSVWVFVVAAATKEKLSSLSEILLQPINEIYGVVKLPGSKSLSNRILLLAPLSGVNRFTTLLSPRKAYVEGDASSASYFLAGAEITGGTVTVEGCGTSSLQGDVRFAEVLEKMGAKVTWTENSVTDTGPPRDPFGKKHLCPVDVNMNKMPDVAMTLVVVALFVDDPTTVRDVASWRVKETERMIVICTELRKLGATVEEGPDYCVIIPSEKLNVTAIDTYDDHRMSMAFSLAACSDVPDTIKDPGCIRKTFPDYFEVLKKFTKH
ncbi:3-phosphoshikimate 1-carboxyvinyltransferase 2-like [Papaver somniferum]|uniref:3-phosphoshikimate 1-carboxyvinyltransferase 2-like n=1 Tax=Papaver somniferum TaxID=3469 RepID=UPI000E70045B|nr:3-phosphoshikimate 1-carboxyvinyltransferase 2-like [Papaver somniferum]